MWQVKKEVLFERSLPEARWSAGRYQPEVPQAKRVWKLKVKDESAKVGA